MGEFMKGVQMSIRAKSVCLASLVVVFLSMSMSLSAGTLARLSPLQMIVPITAILSMSCTVLYVAPNYKLWKYGVNILYNV
jgi:hypothetical protein